MNEANRVYHDDKTIRNYLQKRNIGYPDEIIRDDNEQVSGRDYCLRLGISFKQFLLNVDTDDDYFPIDETQLICKIIDPFGTDEELADILSQGRL